LVAPEAVEPRQGARDPLLAVTMRLFGALSGYQSEAATAGPAPATELPLPLPGAVPPAPPRQAAPRAPRLAPPIGPAFRT